MVVCNVKFNIGDKGHGGRVKTIFAKERGEPANIDIQEEEEFEISIDMSHVGDKVGERIIQSRGTNEVFAIVNDVKFLFSSLNRKQCL